MKKALESFNLKTPVSNLLPKLPWDEVDNLEFRNLTHFINTVSKITQKQDDNCGLTYKEALNKLIRRELLKKFMKIISMLQMEYR
jgi:hypothetical protein